MKEVKKNVHGIPVLEFYDESGKEPKPLVILQHGFTGNKADLRDFARELAKRGFYAVSPDAYLHGDLADPDLEKKGPAGKFSNLDKIIVKTADAFDVLLEYYKKDSLIDSNRTALLGVSMGGIAVYRYLTGKPDPSVRAAVPVISTPSIRGHLQSAAAGIPFLTDSLILKVSENEPAKKLSAIRDIPMLLLSSTDDPMVPVADVREAASKLKKQYSDPEKIELREFRGIGHEVVPEMLAEAADWLEKI